VQNSGVTFYDESLTLGQWLFPERKLALYKYFLKTKRDSYVQDAAELTQKNVLSRSIANGEILYELKNSQVSVSAREIGTGEFSPPFRELRIPLFQFFRASKLARFFAQTEVDVLSNFPVPIAGAPKNYSININAFPYYDLRYYSKGRGRVQGFINKVQIDDSELVRKLMSS
jgi:hypothetical protein